MEEGEWLGEEGRGREGGEAGCEGAESGEGIAGGDYGRRVAGEGMGWGFGGLGLRKRDGEGYCCVELAVSCCF